MDEDGSDVESEDTEVHDDSNIQSESNDGDLKPKAKTGLLDVNISNSKGTQEGGSRDEITNVETAFQEKTNKVWH